MRRTILTLTAVAALMAGSAAPAMAADAPASWSTGFPAASAIGPSLGTYSTPPMIDAQLTKQRWYVCADLQARPAKGLAMATYEQTPLTEGGVRADARVYTSAGAAKGAFTAITTRLKKCAGTGVEESEPGSSTKWQVTTTVGKVPSVSVNGVSSLFVYNREKPAKGSTATQAQLGSSYSVLTLSGDTILVSTATVSGASQLSAEQRGAVGSFASAFVDSWSKANG